MVEFRAARDQAAARAGFDLDLRGSYELDSTKAPFLDARRGERWVPGLGARRGERWTLPRARGGGTLGSFLASGRCVAR